MNQFVEFDIILYEFSLSDYLIKYVKIASGNCKSICVQVYAFNILL